MQFPVQRFGYSYPPRAIINGEISMAIPRNNTVCYKVEVSIFIRGKNLKSLKRNKDYKP